MSFSIRGFDQILLDVQEARAWYELLGISTEGTRLALIEERVTALLADLKSEPPEKVVKRWNKVDTYYVLSDGAAFGAIAREIRKIGPNLVPKKSLRILIEGPLSPLDEVLGDGSVNARNVFTELELAAHFSKKGIPPTGFRDLRLNFQAVDYSVQCKRLLSAPRVSENIGKAYDQLKTDLVTDNDRGLIALATDKFMGLEGKILPVENEADVSAEAFRLAEEFKKKYGGAWSKFVDPRVVAILLISRFLCYSVGPNVIGPAYYINVLPLVSEAALQATDLRRLREIVSGLR
jgi:hypothetical protein